MCVNFLYYQVTVFSNLLLCGRTDLLSNLKSYLPQELNTISNASSPSYYVFACSKLWNLLHCKTTQNGASRIIPCVIVMLFILDNNCSMQILCVRTYALFHTLQSHLHNRMIQPPAPAKAYLWPSRWIWTIRRVFPLPGGTLASPDASVWLTSSNAQSIPITTCWVFCDLYDAMNLSDCQQYCNILYPHLCWIGYKESSEDGV